MFNFSWAFKFWLDSPIVPVISMKEAVSFVLDYPSVDSCYAAKCNNRRKM